MSTHETNTSRRSIRWVVPAVSVTIGLGYFAAGWLGDNLEFGFFGLGLMLAVGLAFVLAARRSETVAGLMDRRDERINGIDLKASMFAGTAVLLSVLIMFVVEIARGQDGSPYFQLGSLGGVAYLIALVYLRFRR